MKFIHLILLGICSLAPISCKGKNATFISNDTIQDSIIPENNPLKIERDALGAVYYWIDNNALDLARIDYSDLYETYMTPIEGQLFEDCTQLFIEGKLRLEPAFLKTYRY